MEDLQTQIHWLEQNCSDRDYDQIRDRLISLMKSEEFSLHGPEISHKNAVSAWRGRKCDSDGLFDNLSQIGYPPPECTSLGRANLPGAPVFYSSGNWGTMLAELAPDVGDIIQVVGVAPIGNVPSLVIGDLQRMRFSDNVLLDAAEHRDAVRAHYSSLDRGKQDRVVYIDSFLADCFRDSSDKYYALTACCADVIFSEQSHVLWYPSVRVGAGLNIAIPASIFDSRFKSIIVKALKIRADFGHGAYDFDIIYSGWKFGQDGSIDWHEGDAPKTIQIPKF